MKVVFYKASGTGADKLIRWWTNGPYSHVEIVLQEKDGQSLCASAHINDGGVRTKWITIDPASWDTVEIEADADKVAQWFKEHDGAKYDLIGLLGFVFQRGGYDRNKYFCSEAIANSLGIEEGWRYDPNTFKTLIDFIAKGKQNG